jgi:hypothetical protein
MKISTNTKIVCLKKEEKKLKWNPHNLVKYIFKMVYLNFSLYYFITEKKEKKPNKNKDIQWKIKREVCAFAVIPKNK